MSITIISKVHLKISIYLILWMKSSLHENISYMNLTTFGHSNYCKRSKIRLLLLTNSRINYNRPSRALLDEIFPRHGSVFEIALLEDRAFIFRPCRRGELHIEEM